jgi:hypothetical protein
LAINENEDGFSIKIDVKDPLDAVIDDLKGILKGENQ